jgi:hypothetical protein
LIRLLVLDGALLSLAAAPAGATMLSSLGVDGADGSE